MVQARQLNSRLLTQFGPGFPLVKVVLLRPHWARAVHHGNAAQQAEAFQNPVIDF